MATPECAYVCELPDSIQEETVYKSEKLKFECLYVIYGLWYFP